MIFGGVPVQLALAFLVDSFAGDPGWLPHPIRCIGVFISYLEGLARRFSHSPVAEKILGGAVVMIVAGTTYLITYLSVKAVSFIFQGVSVLNIISVNDMVLGIAGSLTIAFKGLRKSAMKVVSELRESGLESARRSLGRIVGRDTEKLSKEGVLRATVETFSENASDGVVAPMFYFAIGGLPLAMAYKAINTLDSMLGYRNERYINFGYVAARLDDIVNYIPARLTAWLIVLSALFLKYLNRYNELSPLRAVRVMLRDGRKHLSPNAGMPEAAVAGALGIQLGGPSSYEGIVSEKPFIGDSDRKIELADGLMADRVIGVAGVVGMISCLMLSVLIHGT